jgi:hypothetical protein
MISQMNLFLSIPVLGRYNIMSNVVKLFDSKSPVKSTTEPVKPTVKRRLNDVSPSEWDRVSCKYVTIVEKK